MNQIEPSAVILLSLLGTYALLLLCSKRYRSDTVKMFRLKKSSLRVAIENPIPTAAHTLSLILPVYLMGLPF